MSTSPVICVSPLRCALRRLEPRIDEVSKRFFDRLVRARPDISHHFARFDNAGRRRMLLTALLLAVESEEEPDLMERTLRGFGRRHANLSLRPGDYAFFGETMRRTLRDSLDAAWTPPVERAWQAAFAKMAEAMYEGQRPDGRDLPVAGHAGDAGYAGAGEAPIVLSEEKVVASTGPAIGQGTTS